VFVYLFTVLRPIQKINMKTSPLPVKDCKMRIRVKIGPQNLLVCRKRQPNGVVFRRRPKTDAPCHSMCCTIKIPPCSNDLSAQHRSVTLHRQWWRLHRQWWCLHMSERICNGTKTVILPRLLRISKVSRVHYFATHAHTAFGKLMHIENNSVELICENNDVLYIVDLVFVLVYCIEHVFICLKSWARFFRVTAIILRRNDTPNFYSSVR
jgi:hypothetical protein